MNCEDTSWFRPLRIVSLPARKSIPCILMDFSNVRDVNRDFRVYFAEDNCVVKAGSGFAVIGEVTEYVSNASITRKVGRSGAVLSAHLLAMPYDQRNGTPGLLRVTHAKLNAAVVLLRGELHFLSLSWLTGASCWQAWATRSDSETLGLSPGDRFLWRIRI